MSFFFVLLYLFLTFIRPQEWIPAFFNKPIILAVSLVTIFLIILERFGNERGGLAKVPQNKLMMWLYFGILMSHLTNTYFFGFKEALMSFLVIFILFFLMLNGLDTEFKFKIAFWFIVSLMVVLVFQGMYQIEHGYGWAGQNLTLQGNKEIGISLRINWVGIFSDPNDLGLTFVMAVGMVLAFIFGRTNFVAFVFSIAALCLLLYGLFLTNSRGGLLALMAAIYFFMVRRTNKIVIGSIIGGLMAAGIFALGPSRLGLISTSESSAYGRVELWYQGIQLIKRRPIFGVGYDMFTDALPQTAHNSYVLAGAELGIFGLFMWMALIYCSFKGLSIIQRNDKALYSYALGLQSSLIGFCAAAFFLSRTYVILPYMLFSLSGSLMHIAKLKNPSLDFTFTRRDAWITLFISIGTLVLALIVVKIGI